MIYIHDRDFFTAKKCVPCEGGTRPLSKQDAEKLLTQVSQWKLDVENTHISKKFSFTSFPLAVSFVNKIAKLAEKEGHHPDMAISYRNVTCTLTTHAIHGLSENDFIMAAKINSLHP